MLLALPTQRARDVETDNLVVDDSVQAEYQKCEVRHWWWFK